MQSTWLEDEIALEKHYGIHLKESTLHMHLGSRTRINPEVSLLTCSEEDHLKNPLPNAFFAPQTRKMCPQSKAQARN